VVTHARTARAFKALAVAFAGLNWFLVVGMLEFAHRRFTLPLLRWLVRGGRATVRTKAPDGGAGATLRNGACTFEEITLHKVCIQNIESFMAKFINLIPSKGVKQQ